ncbi:hypothetical protein ACJJIQ_02115 [Microbulbifer sp. ANSA003]|uniref:hypothetical protein n=1 Tax=Microbulbifer sp. ANSA003 TaxID=3243360 RepID=UPI0040426740
MKITISAKTSTDNIEAVKLVRSVTGCALSTAKKQLSLGKGGFFYTTEFFMNDFPERAQEVVELVNGFSDLGLELFIIEIGYNESWSDVDINNLDKYEVSAEVVLNTIESSVGDYE